MKNLNKIIGIIVFGLISSNSFAQDIHFSQFYTNPLQQNPAMAGLVYGMEANVIYKDQWRAIGAPYKTFAAGYDMRFQQKRSQSGYLTAGINLFSDKAGDSQLSTTSANLSLAYVVKLDKFNRMGGGVQLGYFQKSVDFTALQWGNQYDGFAYDGSLSNGEQTFGTSTLGKFDMGAGLSWIYNNTGGDIKVTDNHDLNFNAGISVLHLNRPNISFYGNEDRLPMRFVAHANGVISFQETKMALVPGLMYYKQGKQQEIYFGTLVRYLITQDSKYTGINQASAFYMGTYIRAKDAITAKFIYEYAGWGIGIAYDINTSSLKAGTLSRGGLEIALKFNGPNPFIKSYGANHSRY